MNVSQISQWITQMYKINKSPTGKWIVRLGGSVVYVADTKKKAQEYIDRFNKSA